MRTWIVAALLALPAVRVAAAPCVTLNRAQAAKLKKVAKEWKGIILWSATSGLPIPGQPVAEEAVTVKDGPNGSASLVVEGTPRDLAEVWIGGLNDFPSIDNAAAFVGCKVDGVPKRLDEKTPGAAGDRFRALLAADGAGRGQAEATKELSMNLRALYQAEMALKLSEREIVPGAPTGLFWAFPNPLPRNGTLGKEAILWTPKDLQRAQQLDWIVEGKTLGRYAVAVAGGEGAFGHAMSLCGETDADGDGRVAAMVLFVPGSDAQGNEVAPPLAPCTASPVLAPGRSLQFEFGRDPVGIPFAVSPDGVN
jgi:hypothetical protein